MSINKAIDSSGYMAVTASIGLAAGFLIFSGFATHSVTILQAGAILGVTASAMGVIKFCNSFFQKDKHAFTL